MLCLGRKPGQTVVIGDAVVHIVKTRSGGVVLGIEAPAAVGIMRGELLPDSAAAEKDSQPAGAAA